MPESGKTAQTPRVSFASDKLPPSGDIPARNVPGPMRGLSRVLGALICRNPRKQNNPMTGITHVHSILTRVLPVAVALAISAPAQAQSAPPTVTERAQDARTLMVLRPANVASALRGIGLELTIFQESENLHIFRAGNTNVYIENCGNLQCTSVRMETGVRRAPTSLEMINRLNRTYSGVRFSQDPADPGMVVIDVVYNSTAGLVSIENLRSLNEYLQYGVSFVSQNLPAE